MKVSNYIELKNAIEAGHEEIELINSVSSPESIRLGFGQKLLAKGKDIFLSFINGDGLGLVGNNKIANISIQTSPSKRAIYLDSPKEDLGEIVLEDLVVTGMVQILTRGQNTKLDLRLSQIDIVAADARNYPERPMKYGVNVYQGALTIYNFNPDPDSHIRVWAEDISIGRDKAPVIGTGIFISGFNDDSGPVTVERLTTKEVYSNGMIPSGQPNLITGGIFIVYGAYAKEIISKGQVKTYGTNDMVLDVWGRVDSWICQEEVISYGPSGIGFVNFGQVGYFKAEKAIRTYGLGARGFNQYDGTIEEAYFESIKTRGDGSIGMQFSKPVGKITIGSEVLTSGSIGQTLVKGEIKTLQADGISVLEGGEIEELDIRGDLKTSGEKVISYNVDGGRVNRLKIAGQIVASGQGSREVHISEDGYSDRTAIEKYL